MIEIINSYYTALPVDDIWSCISAIGTLLAVCAALGMHIHSEYKRDKKEKFDKIEKRISFLKGVRIEISSLREAYLPIHNVISVEYDFALFMNRDYMSFYDGNVSNISCLNNDLLQSKIVSFYILIRSNIDNIEIHQHYYRKIQDIAFNLSYTSLTIDDYKKTEKILFKYREILKNFHPEIIKRSTRVVDESKDLIETLGKEIEVQETKLKELK